MNLTELTNELAKRGMKYNRQNLYIKYTNDPDFPGRLVNKRKLDFDIDQVIKYLQEEK